MDRLIRKLNPLCVDSVTRKEIERFERYYRKLKEKYIRGHAGRKKLEILEMECQTWCK